MRKPAVALAFCRVASFALGAQGQPTGQRSALQFRWEMDVTYPDNERKSFAVMPDGAQIPIRSSSWKCFYPAIQSTVDADAYVETMHVQCDTAAGASMPVVVLCGRKDATAISGAEAFVIFDLKTSARHAVHVTCKPRP